MDVADSQDGHEGDVEPLLRVDLLVRQNRVRRCGILRVRFELRSVVLIGFLKAVHWQVKVDIVAVDEPGYLREVENQGDESVEALCARQRAQSLYERLVLFAGP